MKKKRLKWKNISVALLFIICVIVLIISLVNIFIWKRDNKKANNRIEEVQSNTKIEEVDDSNTELVNQNPNIDPNDPYWNYIKMSLINVDFTELQALNPDVIGWIQILGTNINYPFVQGVDNSYYLDHSIDKSNNQAGWIFLDYRNLKNSVSKNNIIYGHSLKSGAMLGTLYNTLKSNWQSNTNNFVIKISTPYENTLWQIFSVYHLSKTNDYLKVNFSSNEEFLNFANMVLSRSAYNFGTTVNENDSILTLSTCYIDGNNRMVVHAKLIKKEVK